MVNKDLGQSRGTAEGKLYKLPRLDLTGSPDVQAAAQYIFAECSHHLTLNFERYCASMDDAALMQVRVGMRRTRVAMKAFKPIIYPEIYKNFKTEFRFFGRLLGEARDLDVFLRGMLNEKCPLSGLDETYEELRHRTRLMRDREYNLNQQQMTGGRFESLLLSFDAWRDSDWSLNLGRKGSELLTSPVAPFAVNLIEKGRRSLLSRGTAIENLSMEDLHTVRKYVKRSRYHLRFFSSLFSEDKITEGYDLLARMQDSLGYVNDVREGLKVMGQLGGEVRADHISNSLRLMAVIVAKAGDEVESHLGEFAELMHRYESFVISEADLR